MIRRLFWDGTERTETNDRGASVRVRTRWEQDRLVTERVETLALPGSTTELTTKEVRWVEPDGRMAVDVSWTSNGITTTRRTHYRREGTPE